MLIAFTKWQVLRDRFAEAAGSFSDSIGDSISQIGDSIGDLRFNISNIRESFKRCLLFLKIKKFFRKNVICM